MRQGRREAGAEIRLAANRKPYYDDDELEGRKLERTQLLGVAFLAVITIVLKRSGSSFSTAGRSRRCPRGASRAADR